MLRILPLVLLLTACTGAPEKAVETKAEGKPVVYQVFTRLFGNKNTTNKQWGTMAENGVGKFNDFTDTGLKEIKAMGVSHIWYTGVPHHGAINGHGEDDPDVIKGRAGSPYAIKDYYDVNPDLAVNPEKRIEEFEALIERTHKHGMKVIIDIVPNHVARNYRSSKKPEGVEDFGQTDDKTVAYHRDNNFYYVVGEDFKVPQGYVPLGGEQHPLADGKFEESPAKWTGNGSRRAQPDINDWFETVKVNFGVRPDGTHDFPELPAEYANKDYRAHAAFWQGKDVPGSWLKFRDIAYYWLDKGVNGFRYDMAEMVPVAFWSFMNSAIKMRDPDAFLLAEVYNPKLYRDYIHLGKMDYLYDKVEFYDTIKAIIQGKAGTSALVPIQHRLADIEQHMLHFMENHDEHRINTPEFAGKAENAKPAMVVSTLISRSPTMMYFGQEVGEAGEKDPGFGDPSRTTIFDYWGVPAHQRWMNGGKFDGGQLSGSEIALRDFYLRLLSFSAESKALTGQYQEIHSHNLTAAPGYNDQVFSFVRWQDNERLLVVSNFSQQNAAEFKLQIPADVIAKWQLKEGEYVVEDKLYGSKSILKVAAGVGLVDIRLAELESLALKISL
jgi:glycosidase